MACLPSRDCEDVSGSDPIVRLPPRHGSKVPASRHARPGDRRPPRPIERAEWHGNIGPNGRCPARHRPATVAGGAELPDGHALDARQCALCPDGSERAAARQRAAGSRSLAELTSHPAGAVVIREGTPVDALGIVVDGRVAIRLSVPGRGVATVLTVEPVTASAGRRSCRPTGPRPRSSPWSRPPSSSFDGPALRAALDAEPALAAVVLRRVLEAVGRRLQATRTQLLDLFAQADGETWSMTIDLDAPGGPALAARVRAGPTAGRAALGRAHGHRADRPGRRHRPGRDRGRGRPAVRLGRGSIPRPVSPHSGAPTSGGSTTRWGRCPGSAGRSRRGSRCGSASALASGVRFAAVEPRPDPVRVRGCPRLRDRRAPDPGPRAHRRPGRRRRLSGAPRIGVHRRGRVRHARPPPASAPRWARAPRSPPGTTWRSPSWTDGFVVRSGSPAGAALVDCPRPAARRPVRGRGAAAGRGRRTPGDGHADRHVRVSVPRSRPRPTTRAGPPSRSAVCRAPTARSCAPPASVPAWSSGRTSTGHVSTSERTWDSCFTDGFARVAGGSFRPHTKDRYRQWLTHKFSTWWDQFGESGCVGCGRCIAWCPVGIDVRKELVVIARSEPHDAAVPRLAARSARPSRSWRRTVGGARPHRLPGEFVTAHVTEHHRVRPRTPSRSTSGRPTGGCSRASPVSSSWPRCRRSRRLPSRRSGSGPTAWT